MTPLRRSKATFKPSILLLSRALAASLRRLRARAMVLWSSSGYVNPESRSWTRAQGSRLTLLCARWSEQALSASLQMNCAQEPSERSMVYFRGWADTPEDRRAVFIPTCDEGCVSVVCAGKWIEMSVFDSDHRESINPVHQKWIRCVWMVTDWTSWHSHVNTHYFCCPATTTLPV